MRSWLQDITFSKIELPKNVTFQNLATEFWLLNPYCYMAVLNSGY